VKNCAITGLGILFLTAGSLTAAPMERWIHVRVESTRGVNSGVTFNFPIEMAAVLPSIPAGEDRHGKFNLQASVNGTDLRAVLNAIHDSADHSSVSFERRGKAVSVTKLGDDLVIKIADKPSPERHTTETIVLKIPLPVAKAMVDGGSEQLDIGAGIRALARQGDVDVTVNKEKETVRVWTDTSKGTD
jgi:hypothetical protein